MTKLIQTNTNCSMNKALKTNLIHFWRMLMSDLTKKRLTHWRTPSVIRWSLRDKPWLVPLKMRRNRELKLPIGLSQLARVEGVIAHAVQFFETNKNVITKKITKQLIPFIK